MNFDELKKRYENEAEFNHLVKVMYDLLYKHEINVSDLKSAAYFAALKFESENIRPFKVTP